MQVAPYKAVPVGTQDRLLLAATRLGVAAAGMVGAAGRAAARFGYAALYGVQPAGILEDAGPGHGCEEVVRIRVEGVFQQDVGGA